MHILPQLLVFSHYDGGVDLIDLGFNMMPCPMSYYCFNRSGLSEYWLSDESGKLHATASSDKYLNSVNKVCIASHYGMLSVNWKYWGWN